MITNLEGIVEATEEELLIMYFTDDLMIRAFPTFTEFKMRMSAVGVKIDG